MRAVYFWVGAGLAFAIGGIVYGSVPCGLAGIVCTLNSFPRRFY